MKRLLAIAAFVSTPALAADPTCDSILQAIDLSHRRAVLEDVLARSDNRNPMVNLQRASNELATMNANVTLASALKCPLPHYPLSIPGPYSEAATACAVALINGGGAPDPCKVLGWRRNPTP